MNHTNDPTNSVQKAVDSAQEALSSGGCAVTNSVGRFVKDHPVSAALAGLGVAWMLFAPKSTSDFEGNEFVDYRDADDEYAGSRATNNNGGSVSGSTIAAAKQRMSSGARHVAEQAQAQTDRLARGLTSIAQEQPLVLAALGIALGAAIGAALPESNPEDRWFGPTRDKAFEKVKERGEQAYEQVRAAAVRGVEGVKNAVANVVGIK